MAGKSTPKRIMLAARRSRVLSLRRSGLSFRAIAQIISLEFNLPKYEFTAAYKDLAVVLWEIADRLAHDTQELLQLELQRLDAWLARLQPKIEQGDPAAIGLALRLSDRRCKLLGLDPPISGQVEQALEGELSDFMARLEALLPAELYVQVLRAIRAIGGSLPEA